MKPKEPDTKLKCLNPKCDGVSKSRGLCMACYSVATRLVKTGKVTWAGLESAGKILPSKHDVSLDPRRLWLLEGVPVAPDARAMAQAMIVPPCCADGACDCGGDVPTGSTAQGYSLADKIEDEAKKG